MKTQTKQILPLACITLLACLGVPQAFAAASVSTPATASISADTAAGVYTTLTGPVLDEGANRDIGNSGSSTIILNAPTGFAFDTAATVTATVSRLAGSGTLLTLSSGTATVASGTITITVSARDQNDGTTRSRITWSGIRVRPTAGTPLANGNITRSGTANITGVSGSTSFGALTETPGAATRLAFTTQPGGAVYKTAFTTQPVVRARDQFNNNTTNGLAATLDLTLTLLTGVGPLTGTTTVDIGTDAGNGTATFSDLQIDRVENGDVLTAAASGLTSTNSSAFNITTRALTVAGVTASDKIYDRTFTATVDASSATLVGMVSPDVVNLGGTATGTFASSNVANGITVAITGLNISGADAANYTLTPPTTTANITAKSVNITSGLTGVSRIYNGTTAATITSNNVALAGLIAGDTVTARTNGYTAAFADKHVGTGKTITVSGMTLNGTPAANYSLTPPIVSANITTTNITVTARTNTKLYDGNTSATNTPNITVGNLQTGDTLAFTEAYSTATIGTGNKVLVPSGSVNDGNGGANYNVTFANFNTGTISVRPLTVTGITAEDKIYDRTFAATLDTNSAALVGVVSPDVVNLGGTATGTFASSNVANGITVAIAGLSISGTDAGNYSLTAPTTTADITAKAVTVTSGLVGINRIYNGTNTATISSNSVVLAGVVGGDTINLRTNTYAASFADKHIGTGKTITVSGLTLFGASSNNYALIQPTNLTANIITTNITVTARTNTKLYDGNTSTTNTPTITAGTLQVGDSVTWAQAYSTATVGVGNKTIIPSGTVNDGNSGANYNVTFANFNTGTIAARTLTVTGVTASDKIYDRTFTATVDTNSAVLVGILAPDVVVLSGMPTGTFASSNVANNITVTVAGLTLGGVDAANYTLTQPTTTADITAKAVTVTSGLTANKIYNGTTTALLSSNSVVLAGIVAGDTITLRTNGYTASFADKHVGTGKTVPVSGLTLFGTSSNNYALTQPTLLANILATNITVTARTNYKIYDATTTTTNTPTITVGTLQTGDTVTWAQAYSTPDVGTNNKAIVPSGTVTDGNSGANYNVTFSNFTTGTIVTRALTVTGVTAVDKIYDRNFTATVDTNSAALVGVIVPDDVILGGAATGTFASSNVANNITVNIAGLTISGADATNYRLTQPTATADITAKSVAIASGITGVNRAYNGTTIATIASNNVSLVGVVSGDTVTARTNGYTALFADKNIGNAKAITISGLFLGGIAANNYALIQPTNLTANITKRLLIVTATGVNKAYDGTTTATVMLTNDAVSGDVVTEGYTTANFADKNIGTNKTVNVSGISITGGADAGNYSLSTTTEVTTANISALPVQLGGTRIYDATSNAVAADLTIVNNLDAANLSLLSGNVTLADNDVGNQSIISAGTITRGRSSTGSVNLGTSISVPLGGAIAGGNTLVAIIATRGTAQNQVASVTSTGATWTRVVQSAASASATSTTEIWYAPNVSVSSSNITINLATSLRAAAVVMEYNGLLTPTSVDVTNSNYSAGTAGNVATTGTSATTAQANELWIGGIGLVSSGHTLSGVLNSFTEVTNVASTSGTSGNNARVYALQRLANATGPASSGGTINASAQWSGAIATFRAPQASAALVLTGAAATNYTLGGLSGSVDITTKALAATGLVANNKVYDGDVAATLSGTAALLATEAAGAGNTADGRPYSGDTVSVSGTASATFADKIVGTAKPVTVTGLTLSGAHAGNYSVTQPAGLAADITALGLTGIITADSKVYDGNTSATIASRSLTGVIGLDDVSLTGGTATFDNKNVGGGKTVTASGFSLTGADAANYSAPASANTTADITARSLTVSAAAQNKAYNGNTTAPVLFSDDRVSGDVLTASASSADFDTKDVGMAKPVSVLGIGISGLDAGNYVLANPTAASSADITAASLTGHITADNKVYDGNDSATIATRTLTGVIGAEDVSLIGGTATFNNKNVGTGKTVTATGLSLSGADIGNYALASSGATTTANITALALTGSVTLTNKIYDGTTNAIIVARSVTGVVGAEDVILTGGAASYDDKNIGTNKNVTITGLALSGAGAANYSLVADTLIGAADITERLLNVSALGVNKTYDATTTATVTLSDDCIVGDALTTAYAGATFADALVGVAKPVTVSGISVSGVDAANYFLANTETNTVADITGALLTPGVTADNKIYDGNNSATIASRSLTGVIGLEDVSLVGGTATFADKNVGAGKTVAATGLSLGGADAGNYQLAATTANTAADIAPASLAASATVNGKIYDGTTTATIATRSLLGVIAPDDVTLSGGSASFVDKNAGNAKTVSVIGMILGGADQANYMLASGDATTTADITARSLTVAAAASNKVYDGNADATVVLSDNRISGDVLTVNHTAASFDNKNVGIAKSVSVSGISMTGADAGNYALANPTASSSADIAAASLTASATADNKVYDGTTAAAIATRSLTGVIAPDDVTISGGAASFADKNVGNGKTVTVAGMVLGGADMSNYALASGDANTTADITGRSLTVTAAASNKVYDGNSNASVLLSDDRISGDALTISHTVAAFDDKNVGNTKPVSISGLSMTGVDAGNYSLANTTVASSADITAASLTASVTVDNKVYDGTTTATIATRALTGVVASDDVTISGGAASFADKNAGNGKAVSVTGLVLGGADIANYTLASGDVNATANITPASLTASATANNKVYDGTTAATIASRSLTGVIGSDDVTVSGGAASFADKLVGEAKPVTVSGLVLGGADLANYTLASGDANATADITTRALTVAATAQNKVYDGNANATVSLSDDRIGGDVLTINHATAAFDNKNVGTGKPVSISGLSMTGADAGNYSLATTTAASSAEITAVSVTASATVDNKVYDGTTVATIASRSLAGVIGADDVLPAGGAASFADKQVGEGKLVSITGMTLAGADLANYTLASGNANATADITARALSVSATAQNKVYDGNANATVTLSDDRISGDVLTISATTASFDNKNVGPAKPVNVSGLSMSGADAGNYTLANTTASGSADITAAALTVSAVAQNKVYDGNAAATVTLSDDRIDGDVLTINHTESSFDNKNAGLGKPVSVSGLSITGLDAGNYNLAGTTAASSADITAASLTASATVNNKVYDGTTAATIASRSLTGVIAPDDVTLTGGAASFADKHVGTGKSVSVTGLTLAGADLANYTLASGAVNATADITTRTLTVAAAAQGKVYDGNTDATVALSDDRISGDALTVGQTSASFDNKNVGTAKSVSVSGLSLTGADADNYSLASTTGLSSADITPASLTASATVNNKVYDGLMAATIAARSVEGVIDPDEVTLSGGSASFADKNVGDGKAVSVTGMILGGADMANYTLAAGDVNTAADITERGLNIVATGVNKVYDATNTATVMLSDDRISGDVFTASYTNAEFASINVGTGIAVNVSGLAIAGVDAANYTLVTDTTTTNADITARPLFVTATAQNKVYDGNTDATVTLSDDHIAGEDVTVSFTAAVFDDKNAGIAKSVTVSGLSMSGAGAGNYELAAATANAAADITAAALMASATADSKVYDGNTVATIAGRTLTGVIAPDDVILSGGTASFGDKNVGIGKTVSVIGMVLGGADLANYTLASGDANTTADIMVRPLAVAALAQSKVYDGNAAATVSLSDDRILGDLLTVSHAAAAFDNKNVGAAKTVTVSGINMTGTDAVNYSLANGSAASSADIIGRSLTVAALAQNKIYDGSADATVTLSDDRIGGDVLTVNHTVASFDNKNVGIAKLVSVSGISTTGADAGNYTLANTTASSSADITAASLAASATVANKVYDGTTAGTIATRLLTGVIAPDDVTLSSGTASFGDKNVGIGKAVSVIGMVLGGADMANYTLASGDANTSADITAASLAASATANSKVYDGTTVATIASRSLTGVIAPDDVTISGGTASFGDKNVGIGKTVSVSGMILGGADMANYSLASGDANTTADITARALSVTAAASSKIYDGNADATVTLSDDRILGDVLTISHTAASFDDKNIGTAKLVSVSGIGMTGADAGNYSLANTTASSSADITARSLTVSAVAQNKVYDANAAAVVMLSDDRISGDVLTVNHTAASFDNKNVGTAKLVSVSGISMTGAGAGNYSLANTTAASSADITARALTITATAQNKVYDGNTNAVVSLADNRISGDVLTAANTDAGFEDANVGAAKTVNVLGLSISGTDAANYSLANLSTTATADITAVQLTVTADNKSRAYGAANPTLTATISGFVNSEDNSVISGSAELTTLADTNSPTGGYPITAALGTLSATNYTFSFVDGTLTITPYALTVTADNQARIYGAANPTLPGSLVGLQNGDDITASYATSADASSPVGVYPITVSLADPDGKLVNYSVTTNEGTLTINAATLLVTADNQTRVYGAPNPTLTATISGFVNDENTSVITGSAAVSTLADEATAVGSHPITAALGTLSAANYAFSFGDGSLEITAASLTLSITANSKVYDGNNSAAIATRSLTGVVGADDVSLIGGVASFADKNAGLGKTVTATGLSLSGAAAGNYTLATTIANTTADITPASLAVSATANNKVYDGTTAAIIATRSLTGVIAPDDVTISGGTASFTDKNVGIGKTVSVIGMVLGGADMANYTLASGDANTTADITAASLTTSATAANKVYDGTPAATIASRTLTGVIAPDDVTLTGGSASFGDKNVGNGKAVTVTGMILGGADLANYSLASGDTNTTADITAAALTGNITAVNKAYDGNADATIASRSLTGVIGLDDVSLIGGTATFNNKNVGSGKPVAATGLSLSGADMANYSLAASSASTTADITAIALTVTADDQSRNYGEANPTLTGTLTGMVAGDNITASYSTPATIASPAGTYDITPTLNDPDSNLGNYVVTINNGTLTILALTPSTIGSIEQRADGNMHIVVNGTPGQVYHLQAVGDLSSNVWSNISTNMANGLGVVEFDDVSATNHTSRFYRVSTP